jgi:mannitol/fructose-specific phosphotransferase system IIA component (Ntr-type)
MTRPSPLIGTILTEANICLNLRASDREIVLKELLLFVPELAGKEKEQASIFQALLERERLHTTGIGDGIALPHTRSPLGSLIPRSILVFGRHAAGIPYSAIDGKPVRLFFLLAAPNLTEHLHILARLSRLLRIVKLRDGLLSAAQPSQILALIRQAESAA